MATIPATAGKIPSGVGDGLPEGNPLVQTWHRSGEPGFLICDDFVGKNPQDRRRARSECLPGGPSVPDLMKYSFFLWLCRMIRLGVLTVLRRIGCNFPTPNGLES